MRIIQKLTEKRERSQDDYMIHITSFKSLKNNAHIVVIGNGLWTQGPIEKVTFPVTRDQEDL